MIAPARLAAYDVLRAVGGGRLDLAAALARARTGMTDDRDRALAGEIAAGTLRWQAAFDHVIGVYARRPIAQFDPEIADILRLTVFQLLYLDRVPASAAVNDAVNLARKVGKTSAAGLVNAVLRRVSRERDRLPLPPRDRGSVDAELEFLSKTLSHPRWLVARWRERYGFEAAEAWCRFDNEPAQLTLRANRLRATREELAGQLLEHRVATQLTRFASDGLVVTSGNPLLTPLAGSGLFAVQDEASQLVAEIVRALPGERILDACAAPGGKTVAMAAAMQDSGQIVAGDLRPRRVRLLSDTVRESGATSVAVVRINAAQPLPFQPVFDAVLIDAPCSGLGTVRRDPDVKWRRSEADLEIMRDGQLKILRSAAEAVKPGGRIVYATCSSEPEENEDVVRGFLDESPAFTQHRAILPASSGGAGLINEAGHLRTLPFRDALEAFFAAVLVKAGDLG
jgi:16S rRNA (cytosine967-C5)-methyltransferase